MSDVSGIPYMGPMGQGNFFAPQFSYQPQMSAGQIQSSYMPEAIQSQNVFNNLYGGGANAGFGRQTDYYSQLAANQLSGAVYSQGGSNGTYNLAPAGTFSDYNAGGAWPSRGGGGGASPYQTTPNVWDTGASPFYGGGGSSGLNSSIYGGGFPSIDWGGVGRAAAGLGGNSVFDTGSAARYGADMFGGLGGTGASPGAGLDWTRLFSGGGADPSPGMKMPGGLNSPMATPQQQQQPTDYSSLFGRGVGGTAGAPQSTADQYAPAPQPSAADQGAGMFGGLGGAGAGPGSSAIDWSKLFGGDGAKTDPAPGMTMPGGLGTPMTAQQPAYDYGSLYGRGVSDATPKPEAGGGGFGSGGNDSQLFGTKPSGSLSNDSAFSYNPDSSWWQTGDRGSSADALAEQARARLADIIGSPETVKAVETAGTTGRTAESAREAGGPVSSEAATGNIPLPQPRPAGADAQTPATRLYPGADTPRPQVDVFPERRLAPNGREPEAFVVHYTTGRPDPANVAADWQRNRPGVGSQFIMGRDGVIHDTLNEYGYGGINHFNPKYINSQEGRGLTNQNTVGMEISAKNDADMTDAQFASLQRFAARNYADTPFYGHGEMVSNREPDEGIRGSQAVLQGRVAAGFPAPAPGATGTTPPVGFFDPVTGVRGPDAANSQAAPRPSVDIPFPDGVPLPTPRPNAEANLSQAHSLLDTRIIDLVQKNSPSQASMVPSSIANQPLREALDNTFTGGMIRSNITPQQLAKAGITQADFDTAYAQGRQSPQRFGGDFGGSGGELPSPGAFTPFEGFRQSPDFENRTNEQLGRDQLAELQARTPSYEPGPEVASTPLGNALGLEMLTNQGDAVQQLMAKYGPEALWAAQGQSQFPQGQTQPLGGNDVSRMPYTQQSPVPGASFPVQLYDDPRYGQASAPTAEAPPQPFPGASEVTQQPYQPSRSDEGNPFFSPTGGAADNSWTTTPILGTGFVGSPAAAEAPAEEPGRDQLAKSMTFGGGFSATPDLSDNVFRKGVGPEMEPPTPEFMRTIAEAESSSNPNKQDPGSQYSGLFQLNKPEFSKYGGTGSIYDPDQNAFAAMGKMTKEGQMAQDALGRELSPVEQYMVHQQGLYGTLSHLTHPDQPAWKSWQQAASSSEEKAKTVIWGNLTPDMQKQFGNVNNITSRDYINMWANKYLEKQIESGQPMTFPGGFSRASP